MKLEPRARWLVLGGGLLVAAWLAFFGDKTPEGAVVIASSKPGAAVLVNDRRSSSVRGVVGDAGRATSMASSSQSLPALIDRRQAWPDISGRQIVDVFSTTSWAPPAPVRQAVQDTVQAPVAPPVPYEVLGKSQAFGKWTVFLSKGGQTLIAQEGDVLEGVYEVRKIVPPQLTLDYIPLHQAQTLDIGDFE